MQVQITFKHMDATETLKAHVNSRSETLAKFVGDETNFIWFLFVEADNHVAEVRVTGPHIDFFAQAKTGDMYQSIDETTDKMERQLRKNKEMVKDHLHRNNRASGA